jgi:arylsulfatase A-like enzyme
MEFLSKCRLFWKQLLQRYARPSEQFNLPLEVFFTILLLGVFYRLKLAAVVSRDASLLPELGNALSWSLVLQFLSAELLLAIFVSAIVWLCLQLLDLVELGRFELWLRRLGMFILLALLFTVSFLDEAHVRLVESMQVGLTWESFVEGAHGFSFMAWIRYITLADLLVMSTPLVIFGAFYFLPPLLVRWRDRALLTLAFLSCCFFLWPLNATLLRSKRALRYNPALLSILEVAQAQRRPGLPPTTLAKVLSVPSAKAGKESNRLLEGQQPLALLVPGKARKKSKSPCDCRKICGKKTPATAAAPLPQPSQQQEVFLPQYKSVRLVGSRYLSPWKVKKDLPPLSEQKKKWNVVFIALESTGFRYIFDTSRGNRMPMPFLNRLSKKSWLFTRHFSPSNSSARSFFSMLSGLNPVPRPKMFAMRRDMRLPSMRNFFGPSYDVFLVQPSLMTWFFPKWFLKHSGYHEMYGFYQIPIYNRNRPRAARNEVDAVGFFLKRLKRAQEPFYATYHTFIPHWPYHDYGPQYRIMHNTRNKRHRYYNNLNLLDQQLQRIVTQLRESGRLKRTILVMVGDHGEAFGQHKGNWAHSRRSFNENFHVPALMYQPKLFKPRKIRRYTTHADVLPTLLDAMGKKYNRHLFQGESLFQEKMRRKYLFLYGNENTLSSIHLKTGVKLQFSFRRRRCWVYKLKEDPSERWRQPCVPHSQQLRDLLHYWRLQPYVLNKYQQSRARRRSFHGQTHPNLYLPDAPARP